MEENVPEHAFGHGKADLMNIVIVDDEQIICAKR